MNDRFATEVLRIGDDIYTWHSLLAAPELAEVWRGARSNAMRVRRTDDIDDHELGVAFRRSRRLLAADDLRAWLAWWCITVPQWRATLVELESTEVDDSAPSREGDELDMWAWSKVVISGQLEHALTQFAAIKAARVAAEERSLELSADGDAVLAQVLEQSTTNDDIRAELERRRLDWTAVDFSVLRLAHADACLEAKLCMSADGESMSDVATMARSKVIRTTVTLDQLGPQQRVAIRSADLDIPIGPLAASSGADIVVVHDRQVPSESDEGAWNAAARIVRARVGQRLVDTYVKWSVPNS